MYVIILVPVLVYRVKKEREIVLRSLLMCGVLMRQGSRYISIK